MRPLIVVVPALALALLAACGSTDDGGGGDGSSPPPPATDSTPSTPPTPDPDEVEGRPSVGAGIPSDLRERPAVAAAIADGAARQNVPESRVVVAAWSPVTWDDGSMGCPQAGRSYTQAQVDGWMLLLRVDMTLLAYHAGPDGTFTYCADPKGTYTVRAA